MTIAGSGTSSSEERNTDPNPGVAPKPLAPQFFCLPMARHQGRVAATSEGGEHGPERLGEQLGRPPAEPAGKRRDEQRVDVIRMPEQRADDTGLLPERKRSERRQIRRVELHHVGCFAPHELAYPAEAIQATVVRIVRLGPTPHPQDSGRDRARLERDFLVRPAWSDHHVLDAHAAEVPTLGQEVAADSATAVGVEIGDVEDSHCRALGVIPQGRAVPRLFTASEAAN